MGAQIMLRMIECALGIVQRSNYAAKMDVQIKLSMEECALGMVQRSNYAAAKDVQNKLNVAFTRANMREVLCATPSV